MGVANVWYSQGSRPNFQVESRGQAQKFDGSISSCSLGTRLRMNIPHEKARVTLMHVKSTAISAINILTYKIHAWSFAQRLTAQLHAHRLGHAIDHIDYVYIVYMIYGYASSSCLSAMTFPTLFAWLTPDEIIVQGLHDHNLKQI